jgi:hydroxylamine reductase (hybrid-cluster protein)
MTDITKELRDIIEKALPAQTANAMADFIEEAEATKEKLRQTEELLDAAQHSLAEKDEEIATLNDDIHEATLIINTRKALEEREEAVALRERDLNLTLAETRLEMTMASMATVERLVEKVFGHPSVTVSTSRNVAVPCESNGYLSRESEDEVTTTTQGKA